jgi:hypothetical protein
MASVAGRCPACGVDPSGSPSGIRRSSRPVSSRPVSSPSGVQPVQCLVTWGRPGVRRSGRRVSTRPASTRLVSSRLVSAPSVRTRPSPPIPGGGVGQSGRRAPPPQQPVESRWAAAPSGGSVDGPAGRDAAELACWSAGPRVADPGRVGYGGGACRCATSRPGRRAERPWLAAERGTGCGCGARWPRLPRGCRRGLVATTVGGGRGACRPGGRGRRGRWACWRGWACGPSAAQAGSQRCRPRAGSAVTCGIGWWACQDLNLGPHPYQLTAGNRCADRRFCRSRSTVGVEGMCSIGPLVCVHPSWR